MDPLVIGVHAFAAHQHVQPPIAEARAHRGVRLEPGEQVRVVDPAVPLVPPRRGAEADDAAGAAQRRLNRAREYAKASRLGSSSRNVMTPVNDHGVHGRIE